MRNTADCRRALPGVAAIVATTVAAGAACAAPAFQAVPLLISNKLPRVRVEMGDATVMVRLDSGAYDFGISLAPADLELAHAVVTGTTHWTDAKGNELHGRTFVVPELRLGGLTVHAVPGTEIVVAQGAESSDLEGMLGFAFLRNYLVVVDFSGGEMRLYSTDSPQPPDECAKGRAPLSIGPAGLTSTLGTEFGRLHMRWDTAAPGNMLTPQSLKIDPSADPYGRQVRLRNVSLSSVHIALLTAQVADLKVRGLDGLLGYDFFQTHRVCFDVRHRLVSVSEAGVH